MRCPWIRNVVLSLTVGAASYLACLSCAAQTPDPEYVIKDPEARTGSRIRRAAVRGPTFPINYTYHQLTAEQRATVHGWYEHIDPGDEPPYPLEGTKSIHDAIFQGQRKLLVTGPLHLVATVEPDGTVSAVKAVGSPSPEMTKYAGAVVMLTKFKPAVCAGRPCRMEFPIWYQFRLE